MEEMSRIIERPLYLDKIRPYIAKNIIKVLTGQRRVGKSYILKSLAREIAAKYPDANIISINLEDFAFAHITDSQSLHRHITDMLVEGVRNFIFIDEIQEIPDFDKVLRSLNLNPDIDIYVTGSNSAMLSSEMASRLAGRSFELQVHPLSYDEFLIFHHLEDTDEALQQYLRFGGLPFLINLPSSDTWDEYIRSVTDAVVYRDVVTRHALRNNDFLQRLLLFLADNIGQIFTAKKIADYLKSQRISSTVNSVQAYVEYIRQAFVINQVRRWEIEGKRFFEIGEKYFFEDIGIRNSVIGFRPQDLGAIMENVVYNHLTIHGFNVRVGVLRDGREIDFVAQKDGEQLYIQVALSIVESDTATREFGNLMDIPDNYRKLVITYNDRFPNTYNGIQALTLRQFLTEVR